MLSWSEDFQQWDCVLIAPISGKYKVSINLNSEFSETRAEILLQNTTNFQGGDSRENTFHLDAGVPIKAFARVWIPSKTLFMSHSKLRVFVQVRSEFSSLHHNLACNLIGSGPVLATNFTVIPSFAQTSSISLNGTYSYVAGQQAEVLVLAHDQYGNEALFPDLSLRLKGQMKSGSFSGNLPVLQAPRCVYISHTAAGVYNIQVALVNNFGLFATYFSRDNFTAPIMAQRADVLDFSFDAGAVPGWSLHADMPFSVRWVGFVRPQLAQVYTLFAGVSGEDERIRVWIDSSLVIDMWHGLSGTEASGTVVFDTANNFYEILVEYKQERYSSAARLSWAVKEVKSIISSTNFGSAEASVGSPISLEFIASDPFYNQVTATGNSLTVATCCVPNVFTIHGRDQYGNNAVFSEKSIRVRIYPSKFAGHTLTSQKNSVFGELGQACMSGGIQHCPISFTCKSSGNHLLSIDTISYSAQGGAVWKNVQGTPFELNVLPGSPSDFVTNGNALSVMTAGVAAGFKIWSKDCGGSMTSLLVDSPFTLATSLNMRDWTIQPFQPAVVAEKTISISYSVTISGMFYLSVQYSEIHINHSPFLVYSFPSHVSSMTSGLELESSTISAGR
jgi:hypothetical protein